MLADCKIFKSKGILPLAYGDRDGYSTDNWVTYDYASYMSKGDIARIDARQLKYTDPKLVKPLEQLVKFKQQGCVNPDASTHENNDANTYFTSGKAAMVQMFPFVVKAFEKALGSKLGVTRLPQSGHGPFAGKSAANSFHNWVIPKNAHNSDGAWEYIKMATDKTGGAQLASVVGALPTNKAAVTTITGPQHEALPVGSQRLRDAAARQRHPGEGGAALLRPAAGGLRRQGHAAQGDAERRSRAQDAESVTR